MPTTVWIVGVGVDRDPGAPGDLRDQRARSPGQLPVGQLDRGAGRPESAARRGPAGRRGRAAAAVPRTHPDTAGLRSAGPRGVSADRLAGVQDARGSSAALIARCIATTAGPSSRRMPGALEQPDAVLAGDRAAERPARPTMISSNAACARTLAALVAVRGDASAGAGCRRRRARRWRSSCRARAPISSIRASISASGPRHADVLGEHRRAALLQRRVGQPAGVEERVGLDRVGRGHRARWPRPRRSSARIASASCSPAGLRGVGLRPSSTTSASSRQAHVLPGVDRLQARAGRPARAPTGCSPRRSTAETASPAATSESK